MVVKKRITTAQIEEALRKSGGFQSQAAKMVGISQQAVSKRIKKSKHLQIAVREIDDTYLDLAESKLINAINKDQSWAICFYLKCKGKHRGYVERQELSGPGGGPVPIKLYDFKWKGPKSES